ncbi:hypothetical protein C5167_002040 [Papaver somniferum]|uniref:Uncharacterized protein n=1 Tax=Papaver somniferum TaxID=3469 RepID=A0A4Y7KZP3_PAPSO|nr:nuclear pore complex protein NUP1-like [Papaver somniferum]RZC77860.1 hypothetical protein C5167_002040 [Papaver somniferum]
MATRAAAATGSYEGGAGGKFQKRPLRNRTTKPYERPITAIRNPIEAGTRNGWISRIVDPAYGLISRTAQNFYKSLFTKSLTAPPPPVTDTNHGQRVQFREAGPSVPSSKSRERGNGNGNGNEGERLNNSLGDNGIDVWEKLFKEKTFTKAEIDRLTEVMHSRAVGESTGNGKKASGLSTSQKAPTQERQEPLHMVVQENGIVSQNLHGGVLAPTFRSNEIEQDVASPTELAKAYMGNRSSKVSPSALGLRSQSLREDVSLLTNAPFTPKSHSMSLVPRSAVRFPTVSENGFMTPRPRGRSAIYNMSRTPYSRVHNSGVLKIDAQVMTPSASSQRPWENSTFSGCKQPSKRRISVLDSDIGTVGPIRRIRQKTNMLMSPSKAMISPSASYTLSADGSYAAQASTFSAQKLLLDESKQNNNSHLRPSENGYTSVPATRLASVPSQSTQMAQKILQQLDKLVPSPKEKSSELRLASARGKSPAKLTLGMLQGQALRSVEDVDSSRFLVTAQSSGALDGAGGNSGSGAEASTSRKQGKVKDNGPAEVLTFRDEKAAKANGVETKSSAEDTVPSGKASEMPPQKRAFQMSAHEAYLDMDDDSYGDRVNITPAVAESEKLGTSTVQSPSNAAEIVPVVKPFTSSSEALPGDAISKADFGASDGDVIDSKKDSSSALSVTPSPSAAVVESAPASQPVSSVENSEPKGQSAFTFNFATKAVESPGVVFGAPSMKKIEPISSTAALAVGVTEHVSKAADLGKSSESTRKADELSKQSENVTSSPVPSSTPVFTFGVPTNSSSNCLSASTTSLFSDPTTIASDASKGIDTSSDTTETTTVVAANGITNPSNVASTSSCISTLPATPAAPFQFGISSSTAVVTSSSSTLPLPSSGSDDKHLEGKTKQPSPFGSLTSTGDTPSNPFGTITGNGIFGFNAGAVNPFANNKSQTPNPFTSATGSSVFSTKAATDESVSGTAPSTNSTPGPFVSSAPSFGFASSTPVSSISSSFVNSAPSANPFGVSTGFGQSSSTSFSMTAGTFSSGTTASGLFSSSSQSSPSPVFPTGGFSFGASKSDAGSTPAASTGFSFGSVTTPVVSSAPLPGSSPFSFTSVAGGTASSNSLSPAVPGFGTASSVMFGTSTNNDQMNMEDSMAEDVLQASAPVVPAFGQPTSSTSPYMFSSPPPSGGSPFMFGGQQNPVTPQMPNPFQPQGEFGLGGGAGSFSLGSTGGGDKSGRKIIKVRRDKLRKR